MSKSAWQLSILVCGLLFTLQSTGSAMAGVITPYSADAQSLEELELDVNNPGKATSQSGAAGKFNFSPSAAALMNGSADCRSQRESHTQQESLLLSIGEHTLIGEVQAPDTAAVQSEGSISTETFNFPVPEPSSLLIWIVLGICGGFLIRRRAKLQS